MSIAGKLELAPGADVTQPSGGWMFTDYTSRALGQVDTDHGRANEASTTQPAQLRCRLQNNDGAFTYLKRGTPLRYSLNPGTGMTLWFQGEVAEVIPTWPAGNSQTAEVQIVAAGVLRRLAQGAAITQSAVVRSISRAPGLVNYAPMEEESGASNFATLGRAATRSRIPVLRAGTVQFGGETTLPGVQRAAVLGSDSYLSLDTAGYHFGGHWQYDWYMRFTGSNPASETIIQRVYVNGSTIAIVDAVYGGGNWGWRAYDSAGVSLGTSIFAPPTGQATGWWHWRLMAHGSSAFGTEIEMLTFPLSGSGSVALATIASVIPGNGGLATIFPSANLNGVAISSWVVYDNFNFSATDQSANGYTGENAITRMQRLCTEESIEISVTGSSSATMGPQKPGGILALLRGCEDADGGILYDGYNGGLSYLAEQSRYNRTATLALDVARSQVKVPFQPTKDDQNLVNDWTLSNPAGDSAQFSDEDNVSVNGRYPSTGTVNLADPDQLFQLAAWRTHLGTADELRVPQLQLELIDRPELWTPAFALRPGLVGTVDNLLTQFPPGQLGVVAEGIQASIGSTSWRIGVNCSPFSPWDTGVLDSDPLDCGASVTASTMTASSTTVDVAVSDACLWSVADGPFGITVGGSELAPPERMTVTAVSGATTATPALVAAGLAGSSNAAPVTPGLPAGSAAGNLMLMLASVRDTNAVTTDMYITGAPGWVKLFDAVNLALFGKVHTGTEVAPTLNYRSDIAGDTIIAQIASFTGTWGDPESQLIGVAQQFNASAQDIAYPALIPPLGGVLVIYAGWKADDWTSVATLGGATEIAEFPSINGNDAGIVWDFSVSAGVPSIAAGSFVVTGGASQISRGCVFAFRSVYQTLTVTRGVSGSTARSHTLGEEVHTTNALVAARQ